MTISTQRLRFLRGNTAASSAFTGLGGELIVDTELNTIRVQDGYTPGGTLLATAAQLANVAANVATDHLTNGAYQLLLDSNGDAVIPGNLVSANASLTSYVDLHKNGLGGVELGAYTDFTVLTSLASANNQWVFETDGNLTIAGNINYANGVNILNGITANASGGNYNDANVAAYLPTYTGNIAGNIVKNGKTWTFGTDGGLTLPDSAYIKDGLWWRSGGISLETPSSDGLYSSVVSAADYGRPYMAAAGIINNHLAGIYANAQGSTVTITTSTGVSNNNWTFDGSGDLTLPLDSSLIKYANGTNILDGISGNYGDANVAAYLDMGNLMFNGGNGLSSNQSNNFINFNYVDNGLILGTVGSNTVTITTGDGNKNWTFDGNGKLTFPDGSLTIEHGMGDQIQSTDNLFVSAGSMTLSGTDGSSLSQIYLANDGNVRLRSNFNNGTDQYWDFSANGILTLPSGGQIGALQPEAGTGIDLYAPGSLAYTQINYDNTNYIYADSGVSQLQTPNVNIIAHTLNKFARIQVADPDNTLDSSWYFYPNGTLKLPANNSVIAYQNGINILEDIVSNTVTGNVGTFNTLYGQLETAAQPSITSLGTLNGLAVSGTINAPTLQISGNATIGNLLVTGQSTIIGNIDLITGNSGQFFGDAGTGFNALYAGLPAGYTSLNDTVLQVSGNYNDYVQINLENVNGGNAATGDYIVTADNGTDTTYYVDMGIAGSNFDGLSPNIVGNSVRANDAYLYTLGNGAGNQGGNLIIGAGTEGKVVKIIAGGGHDHDVVAQVSRNSFRVFGSTTANGNVTTGSYFIGDGSQLTNVHAVTADNATGATYVTGLTSANVTTALGYTPTTYANANVAAYLSTYTGNISFGNLTLSSNSSNIVFTNGATIYGDTGGLNRNGSIVLQPAASGTFPSVIVGGAGRLAAPNGSVHQIFNPTDVTFQVAVKNIVGTPATSTTTGALQISGGAGITGNVYAGVNVVATGNVQGTYFIGNGALLTGIVSSSSNYGNTNVAAYLASNSAVPITTTSNVTANYFVGNGSLLTGIVANTTYNNSNVASYLTGNIVVGNISGNEPNVTLVANSYSYVFSNVGNVSFPGNLTVTANTSVGNIFATGYYYANGAAFTGTGGTSNYSDANVAAYLPTYTGNLNAAYYIGNGSKLTNITAANVSGTVANATYATSAGTADSAITATSATYVTGLTGANVTTALGYTPTTYANANVSGYLPTYTGTFGTLSSLTVGGQINQSYATGGQGVIQLSDGVDPNYIVSVGHSGSTWGGAGSLNLLTYNDTPLVFFQHQTESARFISGGKFLVGYNTSQNPGLLQVAGGISGTSFTWANGTSILDGVVGNYGNANVAAYLVNDLNTGSITTSGNIYGSISYNQPNFIQPNPNDAGWAFGTYTDGAGEFWMQSKFYGLNQTTRGFRVYEAEGASTVFSVNGSGDAVVSNSLETNTVKAPFFTGTGAIGSGRRITLDPDNNTVNYIRIDGDDGGGERLVISSQLSTSNGVYFYLKNGNVFRMADNQFQYPDSTWQSTAYPGTSTDLSLSGNISGGNLTATGNVTGTYFIGNGALLTGITATANYNDSNVASFLSNIGSNAIVTTGNVTAGYFLGNGALLTGIVASGSTYSNTNVAAFLSNIGSNTITTTGNITANYFVGNGALLTGIVASGSTYSNANVVSMLAANANLSIGNVGTAYNTASNITTLFVGNSTTVASGGSGSGSGQTSLLNNLYYDSISTLRYRNTQTGAASLTMGGSSGFSFSGTTSAVTANAASGMGIWATMNGTTFQTYNSMSITSAGSLTTTTGVLATGAAVSTVFNTVASTVNMGGAATTIAMGASTATVTIGSGTGNLTVGNISVGNISVGSISNNLNVTGNLTVSSVIASGSGTYTGNVTAGNLSTPGTGGNISGVNIVFGNVVGSGNSTVQDFTVNNSATVGGTLGVTGATVFAGNVTINGPIAGYAPARPAVRLYGNTSTNWTAGTTISNQVVDYNQGNYYSNSTGLFTVPVAGLYHCYATIRVGNNNALNQAALLKNNNTSGANVIAFWETDTNTGISSHFSITGYAKCVAGDTLSLKVIAGNVQFDTNDSWGITYIG